MKSIIKNVDGLTGHAVLIACPVADLRGRWRKILEGKFPVEELARGDVLTQYLLHLKPSVLLLDLSLPEVGGIEAVPIIQSLSPSTRIILLSGNPDHKEAISALKTGARGYCCRDIRPSLLGKAVEAVQRGEIWAARSVIPSLLEELTSRAERQRADSHAKSEALLTLLTPRECHISQLIGDGLSNKEVALRLCISEKTVKAHLTAIFRKLEISDRLRLALLMSAYRRVKQSTSSDTNSIFYQNAEPSLT